MERINRAGSVSRSPLQQAQLSAERTPLGPGPLLPGRTVGAAAPRPQAPGHWGPQASETASLLSSRELQAADARGAAKQEEKGRGSVQPAWPRGLEEDGVLRLLPQGRGSTGRGHTIDSPDGRARERQVHRRRLRGSRISNWAGGKFTVRPRGGGCFSQRTDTKAEPQKHREPGTVTLPRAAEKPRNREI